MFLYGKERCKKIIGIDIDEERIKFANLKLENKYKDIIFFTTNEDLIIKKCDIIISKDCFEHYNNPDVIMLKMKKLLKPSGFILAGFSPLWKSPYGARAQLGK